MQFFISIYITCAYLELSFSLMMLWPYFSSKQTILIIQFCFLYMNIYIDNDLGMTP